MSRPSGTTSKLTAGRPGKGRPTAVHRDKKLPHSGLKAPIRSDRYREKRYLTSEQRKNPLLRMAYSRLSQLPELRGKYLRDLDTIHGSRRTRSEKFVALAKSAEQILLRLDLATGVLGWLDVEKGQYFLNTQCGIAEDSGLSAPAFNRLIQSLESVDYVYRRIEKVRLDEVDAKGLHLVRTRVLVRFTKKFFAHLGVSYLWHKAQKAAIKKREIQLRQVGINRMAIQEKASLEQLQRQVSRSNWEKSEARKASQSHQEAQCDPGRPEPPHDPSKGRGKTAGPKELMDNLLIKVQAKNTPSK